MVKSNMSRISQEARRLMHRPLVEQHRWYASVLRGHYGYYGVPHNWRSLNGFLQTVRRIWLDCLRRRSQKNRRLGWNWFEDVIARFPLPPPRITHPWTPGEARRG
jgi:RNA-directed DNA polymerase